MGRGRDFPLEQEKRDGEYFVFFPSRFLEAPEGKIPPARKKIDF